MKGIIDRFEREFAIVELENEKFVEVPREFVPPEAEEGDVLAILVDHEETGKRRQRIEKLMKELWED